MIAHLLSLPRRLAGWRADLLAALAGALTAAALPPVHAIPVLLLTLPCLLGLIGACRSVGQAFRRGWWFGFGLNLFGLYWVTEAILVEAERFWWLVPLAVPALAAVIGVFSGVAAMGARVAAEGLPRVLALAGAWTLMDLGRQFILTGFPWNPLGSVWEVPGGFGDMMIQPAALASVHGLTLATVLLGCAPVLGVRGRVLCAAALALWCGGGVLALNAAPKVSATAARVVVVQGNVPQGQKWDRSLVDSIFDRYLALTAEGLREAGPRAAAVIWPETASPYHLQTDAGAREAITAVTGDAIALIGGVRYGPEGRPRNSLFALAAGGTILQLYDKAHLVPFGEYQPDWLQVGVQLVPGGGFAPGPGPTTLTPPGIPPVGPMICYEVIFPGQVADEANRPDWLVNVTNDAWFGNSAGPRQHLAAVRMRAVEEGLPIVRAANTGISAVFDSAGREVSRLGMNQTGVVVADLPPPSRPTVFSRYGLILPSALAFTVLLYGLATRHTAVGTPKKS